MAWWYKVDFYSKSVKKYGNTSTIPLTKELKKFNPLPNGVYIASTKEYILITPNEIKHPIQQVSLINTKLWADFIAFCMKHEIRIEDAIATALGFYIKNYDSMALKIRKFLDKKIY